MSHKGNKNVFIVHSSDNQSSINEKLIYTQNIIQKTIQSVQYYKLLDLFSNNDINICVTTLTEIFLKIKQLIQENEKESNKQNIIATNELLMEKLEVIIKSFGTKHIEDILFISFGQEYSTNNKIENNILESKYSLILKHLQPIGYKVVQYKKPKDIQQDETTQIFYCENKLTDPISITYAYNYECNEMEYNKSFYLKTSGIQTIIKNKKLKKILIINCIVADIPLDFFSNSYIDFRKKSILDNIPNNSINAEIIKRQIESLTLKEILIYGNEDIYKKYTMILNEVNSIKTNKIDITIKNFISQDLFSQRLILMNLLIFQNDYEIQYITYLLYDLLSVYTVDNTHSQEQQQLYNSFPFKIKNFFKEVMNLTIKNTQEMISKTDMNKISLEQQIYLLKAPENVKEKALIKLKEIKNKSDDSNVKAKQYLEGLLKIPFGIYKNEPILKLYKEINQKFISLIDKNNVVLNDILSMDKKDFYTRIEINNHVKTIEGFIITHFFKDIHEKINNSNNKTITLIIHFFQNLLSQSSSPECIRTTTPIRGSIILQNVKRNGIFNNSEDCTRIFDELLKTTTKQKRLPVIKLFLEQCHKIIYSQPEDTFIHLFKIYDIFDTIDPFSKIPQELKEINQQINSIGSNITNVVDALDESIHGHTFAKNQILKIVAQWMTGEQSGYCFGFEGSPGIGKTSLAKNGISKCLKDENGNSRPFAFIALGGSTNGSTLEGHNYTYVNSSWGKIIDILMETKCMNPIIYIDELDKVSNTEQGREIISILTHIIDSTQNDLFQDKYFTGISIDLSKTLFIFSYNDPEKIDKVLLDRIHRIKFDNLTIKEKLTIVDNFIIPDINKKMGFSNIVHLSNETIEFIIEHYTMEPGVRKLKEILFDLYGEINIQILKNHVDDNFPLFTQFKTSPEEGIEIEKRCNSNIQIEEPKLFSFPIEITIPDLENKYLVQYKKIEDKKINDSGKIGIINGLWANMQGKGGIIPIEVVYFPSQSLLELRLTGLQGDVMKESMNVAKTIAWKLTDEIHKKKLLDDFETTKCQGIHIHCADGAVSKDGPSAGAAITSAIYSLFNHKTIRPDIAITGEINLQGDITAIGGLEAKILGGIRSGIKTLLFPLSNANDYNDIIKKYKDKTALFENIRFIQVSHISEVLEHVFL